MFTLLSAALLSAAPAHAFTYDNITWEVVDGVVEGSFTGDLFGCHAEASTTSACLAVYDGDLVRTAAGTLTTAGGREVDAELWCDSTSGLVTDDGLEAQCLLSVSGRDSELFTHLFDWHDLGRYNIGDWVAEYVDEWMEDADH